MRSLLLAWAIALLYCDGVESFVRRTGRASGTPGFVAGAVAFQRKRPRGSRQGASSSQTPLAAAAAGGFTARTVKSQSNWLEVAGEGRRRTQRRTGGGHGTRMLFGLHFQPPEFSVWLHGTVQAVMLGGFAALIPKVTAERIREKEEGMVRDEDYAAGVWDDEEDFDEYGNPGGYVCPTCDNTNQVECSECEGKGFFVSASAMPKKCTYCNGLGTFDCEDCEERREMLRRERGARRPPRELPPARGDDFPFGR
ncbi:unnamed protein product [Ectocarpus sp. 6 AP-2014]